MCSTKKILISMWLINQSFRVSALNANRTGYEDEITNSIYPIFGHNFSFLIGAINKLPYGDCRYDLESFVKAIFLRHAWAMTMFDSTSKYPVGLLHGQNFQLGNFDECISVMHYKNISDNITDIKGKYCLADAILKSTDKTIKWGICMPSSCSQSNILTIVKDIFEKFAKNVNVNVVNSNCYVKTNYTLNELDITYSIVIIIYLFIILSATVYHLFYLKTKERRKIYKLHGKENQTAHKIILSFSIIRNISKILNTETKNNFNIHSVSGLKFLLMSFVIAGHTLLFSISGPVMNSEFYDEATQKIENAIFLNNPLLVDTFLFLSGFLLCFLILNELEKRKGNFNFPAIYLARYLRLTPSYIVVIGFYCTFLIKLNDGPLWNSYILKEKERCLQSWWTNVLYINNYVSTDNLCMFQSWYLAADTQLFFIAPFVIYPLWRYKYLGKVLIISVTFMSVGLRGFETYFKKIEPTLMIRPREVLDLNENDFFLNIYIRTHLRFSTYCVGVIFGFIVHKMQILSIKITPLMKCIGWILAIPIGMSCLLTITIFYRDDYQYDETKSAFYASLHSVGWSFFIGWTLTMCMTGCCETLNSFLSWKLFLPLSRLTYSAYLVNGIVELHGMGTLRTPQYLSVYTLGSSVMSHLILTFGLALILCSLFESPLHNLEKILMHYYNERVKRNRTKSIEQ